MVDEAPRDGRERQGGDESGSEPKPEGFEPPAGPAEVPGVKPWPTLGQEPSEPYATHTEYHDQAYHAGPSHVPPPPRRLYRSERDRVIAGVCGGLSDYLGIDANLLRVAFALMAVFAGGSGLLIYVVLWALVPRESRVGLTPTETAMDAVNEVRDRFQSLRRA